MRTGASPGDNLVLSQVKFQAKAELRGWISTDLVCESAELRGKRGVDDIVRIGLYVSCEGCGKPVLKARLTEYMSTVWEAGYMGNKQKSEGE